MNLSGQLVDAIPLVRGVNDERGVLFYVIWHAIEAAGDWRRIFWDFDPNENKVGDLIHWMTYLQDEHATPLMFSDKEGALAGLIWFTNYREIDKAALIHIWVDPAHRGEATREIAQMATDYGHDILKLDKIIGIAPYWATRNVALKCGYKETDRQVLLGRTVFKVEKEFSNG